MRLILPIRPRRLPGWVRGRSLKTRSRQQESDKGLENLFNSLILRLSLDSFSASPVKRIGASRPRSKGDRGKSADHSLLYTKECLKDYNGR